MSGNMEIPIKIDFPENDSSVNRIFRCQIFRLYFNSFIEWHRYTIFTVQIIIVQRKVIFYSLKFFKNYIVIHSWSKYIKIYFMFEEKFTKDWKKPWVEKLYIFPLKVFFFFNH